MLIRINRTAVSLGHMLKGDSEEQLKLETLENFNKVLCFAQILNSIKNWIIGVTIIQIQHWLKTQWQCQPHKILRKIKQINKISSKFTSLLHYFLNHVYERSCAISLPSTLKISRDIRHKPSGTIGGTHVASGA